MARRSIEEWHVYTSHILLTWVNMHSLESHHSFVALFSEAFLWTAVQFDMVQSRHHFCTEDCTRLADLQKRKRSLGSGTSWCHLLPATDSNPGLNWWVAKLQNKRRPMQRRVGELPMGFVSQWHQIKSLKSLFVNTFFKWLLDKSAPTCPVGDCLRYGVEAVCVCKCFSFLARWLLPLPGLYQTLGCQAVHPTWCSCEKETVGIRVLRCEGSERALGRRCSAGTETAVPGTGDSFKT